MIRYKVRGSVGILLKPPAAVSDAVLEMSIPGGMPPGAKAVLAGATYQPDSSGTVRVPLLDLPLRADERRATGTIKLCTAERTLLLEGFSVLKNGKLCRDGTSDPRYLLAVFEELDRLESKLAMLEATTHRIDEYCAGYENGIL